MKKQKIRFYAALLCSSMVLSLVSTPVSAAETGQLTNPRHPQRVRVARKAHREMKRQRF